MTNLETWLERTPTPVPSETLLHRLEREISLPAQTSTDHPRLSSGFAPWKVLWNVLRPGYALVVGLAVLAAGALFLKTHATRSLAQAYTQLTQVRSVHMVQSFRSGPAQSVIRDASKPPGVSPNYYTSMHPANPLVRQDTWFRRHEDGSVQMVTRDAKATTWRRDNLQLRVQHDNGAREFSLVSTPLDIESMVSPLREIVDDGFTTVPAAERRKLDDAGMEAFWLGEKSFPGMRLNQGPRPEMKVRIWLDESNFFTRKVELLNSDYLGNQESWIQNRWEFEAFNADLDDSLFAFDVLASDAEQVGLDLEGLKALSPQAMSISLKGESGVPFEALIEGAEGTQVVQGTLPAGFVVDQAGGAMVEIRFRDGQSRDLSIAANDWAMQTKTRSVVGLLQEDGSFSAESRP